jgi:hypothetical protein
MATNKSDFADACKEIFVVFEIFLWANALESSPCARTVVAPNQARLKKESGRMK